MQDNTHDTTRLAAARELIAAWDYASEMSEHAAEMDAGFDAGEFSGPAHSHALKRVHLDLLRRYGFKSIEAAIALVEQHRPTSEAVLIAIDGVKTPVAPKNGRDFTLVELRGFIRGYLQIVRLSSDRIMVIDEEGHCKGLPLNPAATALAHLSRAIRSDDFISGPALLCDTRHVK